MAANQMAAVPNKAPSGQKPNGKTHRPKKLGKAVTKLSAINLWSGFSPVSPLA